MASEDVRTLERGNIYFFYRPQTGETHPEDLGDVQRMYMVLSPEEKARYRLAVIGRKRLPDPARKGRGRFWGFIDQVTGAPEPIRDELKSPRPGPDTPEEVRTPAARPVGEGLYRIFKHKDHTHLVYSLELPQKPGEAQDLFRVEDEASYIIIVKNPRKGGRSAESGLGEGERADFPEDLQQAFHGEDFGSAEPPDLLDYRGAEFILVSASEDISEEFGIELQPERETQDTADIFTDLKLQRGENPVKPLFEGRMA